MGDQSFQGLVLSLVVHAALVLFFIFGVPQIETPKIDRPIEVTIKEPSKAKNGPTITETDINPTNDLDRLKEEANILSQLTKRVAEQQIASRNGRTLKNRSGQLPIESEEFRAKGEQGFGADEKMRHAELDAKKGPGGQVGVGAPTFGKEILVGASTSDIAIPGMKEGGFTALNTNASSFYTFYMRLQDQFKPRWYNNMWDFLRVQSDTQMLKLWGRTFEPEVDIQIDTNGEVVRALLMRSSGVEQIDRTILLAFQDAAPFRNPPRGMIESDGLIHLRYGFYIRFGNH